MKTTNQSVKVAFSAILMLLFNISLNAQISNESSGTSFYRIKSTGKMLNYKSGPQLLREYLSLTNNDNLILLDSKKFSQGFIQEKYQQYYKGIKVENAIYNVNSKNEVIESIGGEYYKLSEIIITPTLSEQEALQKALSYVKAKTYMWEDPAEEQWLKDQEKNPKSTFYPKGELLISRDYLSKTKEVSFLLAYKFDVYSKDPLSRSYIYVDAIQGKIIHQNAIIKHVNGTAQTRYSGTRTIGTEKSGNTYRLRDLSKGQGIETYNLNKSTSYSAASDFTDNDNNWTSAEHANTQKDDAALDAHWGAMMTYDYFKNIHGRNSYDGNGAKIKSYVHYSTNYINAFWNGSVMTYGDGGTTYNGQIVSPLTALDVTAHEIGHAVCSNTANLVYSYESGALNEGLSDIWGATIEYYADPNKSIWTIGEDMNFIIRSMSDPNQYENPDTYLGQYWYYGSEDYGGVHNNSGVLNHWYYLLVVGKSGTNDKGFPYTVNAIGIDKASQIVYRMESVYLSANSKYADARKFAKQAAIDLFGETSNEVIQTENAWDAVGVYELPSAPSSLLATANSATQVNLSWIDNSSNETGFSIERSLTSGANYSVIATLNSNVTKYNDTNVPTNNIYYYRVRAFNKSLYSNYANEDSAAVGNPPIVMSNGSITTCSATFLDPGGRDNYGYNQNYTMTVNPSIAGNKIKVSFSSFSLDSYYDYLKVYDGPTVNSPLIATYTGNNLPPTLYGTTATGQLTFQFSSDNWSNYSGWEASISCVTSVPLADLLINNTYISSSSLVSGNYLQLSCTISNQGGTIATNSNTNFYLSTNNTFDSNDILLASSSGASLSPGISNYKEAYTSIPMATVPGNYFVLFVADPTNLVSEEIESNNTQSLPITIEVPTKDLMISSPYLSNSNIAQGVTFYTSCYIQNQGNSPVLSSEVNYFLSSDSLWNASDTYLGKSTGGLLNGNSSEGRGATLAIPETTTPGEYFILYYADYGNSIVETDESNNVKSFSIKVVIPTKDFIIENPYIYTSIFIPGNYITVTCTLHNQGSAPATSSNTGFYLSTNNTWESTDVLLGNVTGEILSNGASSDKYGYFMIPNNTTPGNYYIIFVADPLNAVIESNETNNSQSLPIVINPLTKDLIISNIYSQDKIGQGASFSAICNIQNNGTTPASSSDVGFYLSTNSTWETSDIFLGKSEGGALYAGGYDGRSSTVAIPATTSIGDYFILYIADYENKVTEINESNNISSQAISVVSPSIDLVIQYPYNYSSITAGNSISVSCYIHNQGTTSATSSNVGYYLSNNSTWDVNDVLLGNSTGGILMNGGSSYKSGYYTIPANTTSGDYYILYYADHENSESETNEANNVTAYAVYIKSTGADLTVSYPYLSTSQIESGKSINATCYIYNIGDIQTSSSNIGYYLSKDNQWDASDILLNTSDGGPLNIGYYNYYNSSLLIPSTTPLGTYYILFYADHLDAVAESNQKNNISSLIINVISTKPDLIIETVALGDSIINNYSVSAYCTIKNIGTTQASSSTVGYYLSSNTTWDASDILLAISNGGPLSGESSLPKSATLIIPSNTDPGIYHILFFGDYLKNVNEFSEDNNIKSRKIRINNPATDLGIIISSSLNPVMQAGESMSLSYNISNKGLTSSAPTSVGFFLSKDNIYDTSDYLLGSLPVNSVFGNSFLDNLTSLIIPANTIKGEYYLIGYVDYTNKISERNETNNSTFKNITIQEPTGIEAPDEQFRKILIYPNPNTGDFKVSINAIGNVNKARISLLNVLGNIIQEKIVDETFSSINSNFTLSGHSGSFILKIEIDKSIYYKTVIIK